MFDFSSQLKPSSAFLQQFSAVNASREVDDESKFPSLPLSSESSTKSTIALLGCLAPEADPELTPEIQPVPQMIEEAAPPSEAAKALAPTKEQVSSPHFFVTMRQLAAPHPSPEMSKWTFIAEQSQAPVPTEQAPIKPVDLVAAPVIASPNIIKIDFDPQLNQASHPSQ